MTAPLITQTPAYQMFTNVSLCENYFQTTGQSDL